MYQKSEFNNFNRVDGFDSDLWNNVECFKESDIYPTSASALFSSSPSSPSPAPAPAPAPPTVMSHEERIRVWNDFLRKVALKETATLKDTIERIFDMWDSMDKDEFIKYMSWFRVFEQLLLTKNETLLVEKDRILHNIAARFKFNDLQLWKKVTELLGPDGETPKAAEPGIVFYEMPPKKTTKVYHIDEINTVHILEKEWLDTLFEAPIQWEVCENLGQLAKEPAILLVQHLPGQGMQKYNAIFNILAQHNVQLTALHLSDEHGRDDISWYALPSVKQVIRNYARPDLAAYGDKIKLIPLGFANGRSSKHLPSPPAFEERAQLWCFAGSADRPGRLEALTKLHAAGPYEEHVKNAWSAPHKVEGPEYIAMLRRAKFVPCFRGSSALESYRLYEALEHGAIPIYVADESNHGLKDEYTSVLEKHPLLAFPSWDKAADMLPILARQPAVMEKHRQSLMEWWAAKKAETVV